MTQYFVHLISMIREGEARETSIDRQIIELSIRGQ